MVRTTFGTPRLKSRSYEDSHRPNEGHYSSDTRSRRDDQGYSVKSTFNYRGSRGRGRGFLPTGRRPPQMGEQRESRFNHWKAQSHDCFQAYTSKMDPHHAPRRHSPSQPYRPAHLQHRSSFHSPTRGHHSQRGAFFHGQASSHRSPSPRHNREQPSDRRSGPGFHESFRGGKRQTGFPYSDERRQGPSPRGRPYEHSRYGVKRWQSPGAFPALHNGELRHSGSQRSPREMHGRSSCTERWSSEQDPRRQRSPVDRQDNRSHSRERGQDIHRLQPYRNPSWRPGPFPPPSFHRSPQERLGAPSRKRRMPEIDAPLSDTALEHSSPKYPRRERPQAHFTPRPFGGRPLSLRGRSFLYKSQQLKSESFTKFRVPPGVKARPVRGDTDACGTTSAVLANRKKRFQLKENSQEKEKSRSPKRPASASSDTSSESKSSRNSGTRKEQVESRRSLKKHRSTPMEKNDLVILSHWPPGPSSSSKDCSSPKESSPQSKSDCSSDKDSSPKTQKSESSSSRSPDEKKRGYLEKRVFSRPVNQMQDVRPGRPFRRPPFFQRPRFIPGPRRSGLDLQGNMRRPLMEAIVSRPFNKPVFRKSFSIMSKYRNMRVMRQRGPPFRGHYQLRW